MNPKPASFATTDPNPIVAGHTSLPLPRPIVEPEVLPIPSFKRKTPSKDWVDQFHSPTFTSFSLGAGSLRGSRSSKGTYIRCECGWSHSTNEPMTAAKSWWKEHVKSAWTLSQLGLSLDEQGNPQPSAFIVDIPGADPRVQPWAALGRAFKSFAGEWIRRDRQFRLERARSHQSRFNDSHTSNTLDAQLIYALDTLFEHLRIPLEKQARSDSTFNPEHFFSLSAAEAQRHQWRVSRNKILAESRLGYDIFSFGHRRGWDWGELHERHMKNGMIADRPISRRSLDLPDTSPWILFFHKLSERHVVELKYLAHALKQAGYQPVMPRTLEYTDSTPSQASDVPNTSAPSSRLPRP